MDCQVSFDRRVLYPQFKCLKWSYLLHFYCCNSKTPPTGSDASTPLVAEFHGAQFEVLCSRLLNCREQNIPPYIDPICIVQEFLRSLAIPDFSRHYQREYKNTVTMLFFFFLTIKRRCLLPSAYPVSNAETIDRNDHALKAL